MSGVEFNESSGSNLNRHELDELEQDMNAGLRERSSAWPYYSDEGPGDDEEDDDYEGPEDSPEWPYEEEEEEEEEEEDEEEYFGSEEEYYEALRFLNLSNKQLTSVPAGIFNLTGTTGLNLSGNQLTSVPPEMGNMAGLE